LATNLSPGWATYLRVSDEDKQTPERSFAMQRHRIQEQLLSASNAPLYREYTDLLSGTNPNRKDYQQLLADAEAGKFSHIGLYRADRFGRNTVEGLQAATKLISLGVKIRIANMPSLQPENPDGFFMFLIQMGMAQREVDVLAQRTADGIEAKLRAGGWPHGAPEGYVNKERQISSNKYERWVEIDPKFAKPLKEAWEMLLTGRYTMDQICEELTQRGHTRSSGRPWAWNDPKTGGRRTARNRLHEIFNHPFYAGWVVSERFKIELGEVQGKWESIVTTKQFEKGKSILLRNGKNKSRFKRNHYLLRNLLWVRVGEGIELKLYGSTPSGRNQSYSYYLTHSNVGGRKLRIPADVLHGQVPTLLKNISVDPDLVPAIREVYQAQIKKMSQGDKTELLEQLKRKQTALKEEEARLGRLVISGKITEETYDQLRSEWQEKMLNLHLKIEEMEVDVSQYLDDLEMALALMVNVSDLFNRLEDRQKTSMLQIIINRLVINHEGNIIFLKLHSPFTYLSTLSAGLDPTKNEGDSSFRLLDSRILLTGDGGISFDMLSFGNRMKLGELPV